MRSSQYWKERVWEPSPKRVMSWFWSACMMKLEITRPSFGCMLGP